MHASFVLVFNCGSSSVKFAVVNPKSGDIPLSGLVQRIGSPEADIAWKYQGAKQTKQLPDLNYQEAVQEIMRVLQMSGDLMEHIIAVGHRVVHGGELFTRSVLITEDVLKAVRACNDLAPLHNPANLTGIEEAQKVFPNLPHTAVFDTAFHQTMPNYAYVYSVPYKFYKDYAVRRYGFHGTSHLYVTRTAAKMLGKPLEETAFISAHLGNGCSLAAVSHGKSVDTTMGITPLEGLMMGTRSGDVDPSIHGYLARKLGCDVHAVTRILNNESGLLGIAGVSDMRAIEEKIEAGDAQAILAMEIFCYKAAKAIAAMAVPLGRIDALIFTAGIGENGSIVRANILNWLGVLGFVLDAEKNEACVRGQAGVITTADSTVAMVVPTNEELVIAQDAASFVK